MTQMFKLIDERLSGSLPSSTEIYPNEFLKGVTLRSGIQLPNHVERKPEIRRLNPLLALNLKLQLTWRRMPRDRVRKRCIPWTPT